MAAGIFHSSGGQTVRAGFQINRAGSESVNRAALSGRKQETGGIKFLPTLNFFRVPETLKARGRVQDGAANKKLF